MAPPVIVLGVGRSGTTLLRVMLDRSSQIAIPYESFFVTPLAHRHGSRPNLDDFAIVGELALSGEVRSVNGVLARSTSRYGAIASRITRSVMAAAAGPASPKMRLHSSRRGRSSSQFW